MIERVIAAPAAGYGAGSAAVPPLRGVLRTSLIIGLLCCLVYSANFRAISAGDTYPARYIPFAIWQWHTVLLDPIVGITAQGWNPIIPHPAGAAPKSVDPQEAFWVVRLPAGHAVSLYPVVVPILVSPLYLPAVLYLDSTGWDPQRLDRVARIMEKIAATLVTAASAALLFLTLRRRVGQAPALLLTFAYAFGTTTWVISSQALWQHGVGELLVTAALFLLTGPSSRWRVFAAGIVLGLIACNRPPDALIAAALGVYGLRWAKGSRLFLIGAGLLPVIPLIAYNVGIVGNLAGAYALFGDPSFFRRNPLYGIAGLLVSPTKGLFFFSPFLIFVLFCLPRMLRETTTRGMASAILCAVLLQLLLYGAADWRQGGSWGPRWLTDVLPLLTWALIPVFTDFGRTARGLFLSAVAAAMVIEAIGAFWYTGASDVAIYASAAGLNPMRSAWELQNAPFIAELRHARAPSELASDVRGFLDVLKTDLGPNGREIRLQGWALADKQAPAELIVLIDGRPAASTSAFGPREDVAKTLGAEGPSGWSVTLPGAQFSAGDHRLAILVRAHAGGDVRMIAERSFTWSAGLDLASSAQLAADALATHQQPDGYWLTSHTTQTRFEQAGVEMNTYLPSMMLDLLDPVADAAGVRADVEKARQFLKRQIEPDGLVRYHGLPDAPTIGTLGCAITPDADDTALVWRIAPGGRSELLSRALAALTAFRKDNGLYRTWLAAPERYTCIDPGADPDPADIGIQMNIFLLLSKADPAAATALCGAIRRSIDDARVWVYYRNAPLVPILRQADLREAGCAVQLPSARQQTAVPGQQEWIVGAQLLDQLRAPETAASATVPAREWLQKTAADDFAVVRHSPPLLYHNDETASVSRYYWSDDFGYALWLRLYFQLGRQAERAH